MSNRIHAFCQVHFKGRPERVYIYRSHENLILNPGDKVILQASGKEAEGVFLKYVPEEYVTYRPNARVLDVVDEVEDIQPAQTTKTTRSDSSSMAKAVVSFIRKSSLEQRWVTKKDIITHLHELGFTVVSFESVITQAMKLSNYVNRFQKNAYIYKKREEV